MRPIELIYRCSCDADASRVHPTDADAARLCLDRGNQAFARLFGGADADDPRQVIAIDPRDLGLTGDAGAAPVQHPFAAVLGCVDARVPIELIFNQGPNDLFVVRVAGNTLGDDVLGSLDYALEHLREGLRLVVVLGHSGCGAVTAAVDVFLDPTAYLALTAQTAIRNLVDRLQVVVHACARRMQASLGADVVQRPRYREALIEMSVLVNAALAAHMLQRTIQREGRSGVQAAYGVYLLDERSVWAPRCGSDEVDGLASPPADLAAFVELSEAVLRSRRVAGLLDR